MFYLGSVGWHPKSFEILVPDNMNISNIILLFSVKEQYDAITAVVMVVTMV